MIGLETPEAMAERLAGNGAGPTSIAMRGVLAEAIRARDEQIAAWCDERAAEAQREAEAHAAQMHPTMAGGDAAAKMRRIERCEGQAAAFRAVAAKLRGSR